MNQLKIYAYRGCDSCTKAMDWLDEHRIAYREVPIRETPPTVAELRRVLKSCDGDVKRLFNVAGQLYRAMGIKDRLEKMSDDEALALLAANGNLIKRPVVLGDGVALAGFKPERWAEKFGV